MLVVQINHVDSEPLQAGLAGFQHIFGAPVDAVGLARPLRLAELRRDDHAVPVSFQRLAEHLLVMAPSVHVRGIEVVPPDVDRVPDQVLRHRVVGRAVNAGSDIQPSPIAETDRLLLPSTRCSSFDCGVIGETSGLSFRQYVVRPGMTPGLAGRGKMAERERTLRRRRPSS